MTPVTVVVGLPGAGKSTWIEHRLAQRPAGERWAVLGNGIAEPMPAGEGLFRRQLGPGCACCALRPVLGAALVRLLRAGPWTHLILEADGAAHPDRLVDVLREPALAAHLRVDAIVLIVDGRYLDPWQACISRIASAHSNGVPPVPGANAGAAPDERRAALLACASALVITRPGPDAAAAAQALATAPPFGRPVRIGIAEPGTVVSPPAAGTLACWPAERRFDRRALEAALIDWTRRHPGIPVRGVWATERAWYAWPDDLRDHEPGLEPDSERSPGSAGVADAGIGGRRDELSVSAYRLESRLDSAVADPSPAQAQALSTLVATLHTLV